MRAGKGADEGWCLCVSVSLSEWSLMARVPTRALRVGPARTGALEERMSLEFLLALYTYSVPVDFTLHWHARPRVP